MRIESLRKFSGRNPNGYFNELPPQARTAAWRWLGKFQQRWGRNMPPWRFGILVGQAKRLALNPPDSAWGRSMLAKRGGRAVQRVYRLQGRIGTAAANKVRSQRAQRRKQAAAQSQVNRRIQANLNSTRLGK